MADPINPASLIRRAIARLAEFTFYGELADGAGLLPGFHNAIFSKWTVGYVALALAASSIYDLFHTATRPDLLSGSCVDNEPQLPLGEE